MTWIIGQNVPWNAAWSSEEVHEIRNCRWAGGKPAMWQPHSPGIGRPLFAQPHNVRQRRSIAEMRCTVCGEKTAQNDRWWFGLGGMAERWFVTTEAPVHAACSGIAAAMCPHIRRRGFKAHPMPQPDQILASIIGGDDATNEYGLNFSSRTVVGHMKLAWRPSPALNRAIAKCGSPEIL